MKHTYAAIMAGGTGTRLWPRSRENNPKQLHAFISEKTLIQETVADINPVIPDDQILIVTGTRYVDRIRTQLPTIKHYLVEPYKLGKLLAIGAAAQYLAKLDPHAVMVLLWADSYIGDKAAFQSVLAKAIAAAKKGTNSLIGVRPSYPATQYGYIELGPELTPGIHRLKSFQEKPDYATAERFIHSSRYVWNPGISVWRVDKLLNLYQQFEPDHAQALVGLMASIDTPAFTDQAREQLKDLPKLEIEDTVYRKAKDLAIIPAAIGWDDVGSWSAIQDILQKEGNVIAGKHVGIDTENCFIHGHEKLIATIGLRDIVVVETDDAILIADKHQTQKVKDLVEQLDKHHFEEYL
ncbi:mannose-1-phosphate guanylyltransferase [Candidatus Berkelbacteria bacterium]|nr:mannose-1-phosphate guanylyltransferase [Candidatus Berkelbacteria bacterium]